MYEHWVNRNEHAPLFQGIFHTFPDQKTINLKDLYVRHPTKPDLWAYKGRNDDIIVLSNGYKISPLDTEALITAHPAIEGCLMVSKPSSAPSPVLYGDRIAHQNAYRSDPESLRLACLLS